MATATTPTKATLNKVVNLRDKKSLSWFNIAVEMGLGSPSSARTLYDKAKGEKGAHYNSRPLPGGRTRANGSTVHTPEDKKVLKRAAATSKRTARKAPKRAVRATKAESNGNGAAPQRAQRAVKRTKHDEQVSAQDAGQPKRARRAVKAVKASEDG